MRQGYYRARVLAGIAVLRANGGDAADARRLVKQAGEALGTDARTTDHGFALAQIATVQMKLGDRDTARKTFRQALEATDDWNKILIIEAQAKAGEVQEAIHRAHSLKLEQGLESIAVVQSDAGDFQGALATVESIEHLEVRSTVFARVAAAQQAGGHASDAKRTFQKATETAHEIGRRGINYAMARAVYTIAYCQPKSGQARTALDWARKERSDLQRYRALLGTAIGILDGKKAGRPRGA
jgi:tetratricopeptide (TPR) repeat protein